MTKSTLQSETGKTAALARPSEICFVFSGELVALQAEYGYLGRGEGGSRLPPGNADKQEA